MAVLHVTNREGSRKTLPVTPARSVMELLRAAGFGDILALCGGTCSCATCHVYVDAGQVAMLPPIGEDENDLLDGSTWRREGSRLSCQIPCSEALDGLEITIAPED